MRETYLEDTKSQKVEIGELRELSEEVAWDESPPCILGRPDFVIGEVIVYIQPMIVHHKVAGMRPRYYLITIVVATPAI